LVLPFSENALKNFYFDKYLSKIIEIIPDWLTPNMITVVRLVFIVPVIFFLITKMWALFVIFYILCLASDALDGALSRVRGMHSKFGATLDPVIDKILHWSIFCVYFPFYPLLIGLIILLDIIVAAGGLTIILYFRKIKRVLPVFGANIYGKMKVVSQSACVGAFFYRDLFSNGLLVNYITTVFLVFTILLSCASIYYYIIILNRK
jgi:phosphatidylglycerophosphate synthase